MKKFLSLLVCLMLTLGLIGCASGSDDKSADTDKKESSDEATNDELKGHLVIYTSEPQDLVTEMLDDFVSKNPGVTYELFRSGTGDVKTKLSTELDAGSTE